MVGDIYEINDILFNVLIDHQQAKSFTHRTYFRRCTIIFARCMDLGKKLITTKETVLS